MIYPYRCDSNSSIAWLDNVIQHADSYRHVAGNKLKCFNGHPLTFVKGIKVCSHFRHQAEFRTTEMTEWHRLWQDRFEKTEYRFGRIKEQIRTRYADVLLDPGHTIEFQHSNIKLMEVNARKHDYGIHNIDIIWVVHGNDIELKSSIHGEYLIFGRSWKYESFKEYDYIYAHVGDRMCLYAPNDVGLTKMVSTRSMSIDEFIHNMNGGLFSITPIPRFNLTIKQQGAGNGKTYGLNKNIFSEEFKHYQNIIVITKQHAAKTTIKNTFLEVESDLKLEGILNSDNYYRNDDECIFNSKAYSIPFKFNHLNKMLSIATLDSLTYRIANHSNDSECLNAIRKWADSITYESLHDFDKKSISYNGHVIAINKESLIILDEAQDLDPVYSTALLALGKVYNCDLYIVGDLLQSIQYEHNAFSYLQSFQDTHINIIQEQATNICRRFQNPYICDNINRWVPFAKYGLPSIDLYKTNNDIVEANHLQFIHVKDSKLRSNKSDVWINPIMKKYQYEVNVNNRSPEDFLIIFPILKIGSPAVLTTRINEFWTRRENYRSDRFAILHKSEEGNSINLDESKHATRIVSIHSSKGDGRNVVFVIGLNESTLRTFDDTRGLKYESLFHVAMTRQKETLYITYDDEMLCDDIGSRFTEHIGCPEKLNIRLLSNLRYRNLLDRLSSNENNFLDMRDAIFAHTSYRWANDGNAKPNRIIDMGHHHIRYGAMFLLFIIDAFNRLDSNESTIKLADVIRCLQNKQWASNGGIRTKLTQFSAEINANRIVHFGKFGVSKPISNAIVKTMQRVKDVVIPRIERREHINICTYEALVFYYMFELFGEDAQDHRQYTSGWQSPITVSDLYIITEIYYASYDRTLPGHDDCLCNQLFDSLASNERLQIVKTLSRNHVDETIIQKEFEFLRDHYQSLTNVSRKYRTMLSSDKDTTWQFYQDFISEYNHKPICKQLWFMDFDLNGGDIAFVGVKQDTIKLMYLRPTFGTLNYNSHILKSVYNEYILRRQCNIANSIRIEHIVFSTKEQIMFPFVFDRKLFDQAIPQIELHFIVAIKEIVRWLRSSLKIVFEFSISKMIETGMDITFLNYRRIANTECLSNISDDKTVMYHNKIIDSDLLNPIYQDIDNGLTNSDEFDRRLKLVLDSIVLS